MMMKKHAICACFVSILALGILPLGCSGCETTPKEKEPDDHELPQITMIEGKIDAEMMAYSEDLWIGIMRDFFEEVSKKSDPKFVAKLPKELKLKLTATEAEYEELSSHHHKGGAVGLHSVGFYLPKKKLIILDSIRSRWLITVVYTNPSTISEITPCGLLDSVGTLLHEIGHAIDPALPVYDARFGYFTHAMREALATEMEDFSLEFFRDSTGRVYLPDEECADVRPAILETHEDGTYTATANGSYSEFVIFETLLLDKMGFCENSKETWHYCALRYLLTEPLGSLSAGNAVQAIVKKSPRCGHEKFRPGISGGIEYASAPYLRTALSGCYGKDPKPQPYVACNQIRIQETSGLPYKKMTIRVLNYEKKIVWSEVFEDISSGKVYDLERPLKHFYRIKPYKARPWYSYNFFHPHDPSDPCELILTQRFYCKSYSLDFPEDATLNLSFRIKGRQYDEKKGVSGGETIKYPLVDGSEVVVKMTHEGKTRTFVADVVRDSNDDEVCIISYPATDTDAP